MSGISKSQVSRLCEEIDDKVKAFLDRPIEGEWPYLWIDATYLKVRRGGSIVSVAVIIAVADQIRPKVPKLAMLMDSAEQDELACMTFPKQHWTKLHSTNPIERLNGESKRRTEVVGIFPNDDAILCLVGALLLEQNDEWAVQRSRYMTLETIAAMSNDPLTSLPAAS